MVLKDFKYRSQSTIVKHLLSLEEVNKAQHILYYSPIAAKGEIDVRGVKQALSSRFYLPKVKSKTDMCIVEDSGQFVISNLGIMEPTGSQSDVAPDVILVPGLAFDVRGNRLGYGAGYYDRYVAKLQDVNLPILVGICFSELLFDQIPSEDHDIKMKYVVTEEGIVRI